MLVLSRHQSESIVIGDGIVVTVVDVNGSKVRLGIESPASIPIGTQDVSTAIERLQENSREQFDRAPLRPRDLQRPETEYATNHDGVPYLWVPKYISNSSEPSPHSCFVSFSHCDERFAETIAGRLRDANVSVWYAPEDIQGGQKTHEQIENAIHRHDRLLIVLSRASMSSNWVQSEIRWARRVEIESGIRKLFPIRLVPMSEIERWKCFDADSGRDLAVELREYHIPDFSDWQIGRSFENSFRRLVRDLGENEKTAAKLDMDKTFASTSHGYATLVHCAPLTR